MGWGISKKDREAFCKTALMPSGPAKSKARGRARKMAKRHKKKAIATMIRMPPGGGAATVVGQAANEHTVVVDANAAIRSVVHSGPMSAMSIAKQVYVRAMASKPSALAIYFDSSNAQLYPPQRAVLHQKRYKGKALDYDSVQAICTLLRVDSPSDLASVDVTVRPLLNNRKLPWSDMFMNRELKQFAFRLVAAALRHVVIDHKCTASVRIHLPHNQDQLTLATGAAGGTVAGKEHGMIFGEADLRCQQALLQAMHTGKHVNIHSVDTDFLLMAMASVHTPSPATDLIITLKTGVYNGNALIRHALGPGVSLVRRLNTAFWAFAFGCDYSNPLTHNGYYTKGLLSLMTAENALPLTVDRDSATATFCLKEAYRNLGTLKCNKKKLATVGAGKDSVPTTLKKMLWCLQYYGLMFVDGSGALHPKAVAFTAAEKYTFSIKPDMVALFARK